MALPGGGTRKSGTRKSEFFHRHFTENPVDDNTSEQVTHLELPKAWANMFPMVLDYMYYNKGNKWIEYYYYLKYIKLNDIFFILLILNLYNQLFHLN